MASAFVRILMNFVCITIASLRSGNPETQTSISFRGGLNGPPFIFEFQQD